MADQGALVQLRKHLRQATAEQHSALDAASGADDLASKASYADFLAKQYRARLGVENWIASNAPQELSPPAMTSLIAVDLQQLGKPLPSDWAQFSAPRDADPTGIAWAIAGSHLGNRLILRSVLASNPDASVSFLSDTLMSLFWLTLAPALRTKVPTTQAEGAIASANAVFAHFHTAFSRAGVARVSHAVE